jgi:type III restriction enzyme
MALHPDFIVKDDRGDVWIVETEGRGELDLPRKMARLVQWCDDATAASRAAGGPQYRFAFVDQEGFGKQPPGSLAELATMFREYQPPA